MLLEGAAVDAGQDRGVGRRDGDQTDIDSRIALGEGRKWKAKQKEKQRRKSYSDSDKAPPTLRAVGPHLSLAQLQVERHRPLVPAPGLKLDRVSFIEVLELQSRSQTAPVKKDIVTAVVWCNKPETFFSNDLFYRSGHMRPLPSQFQGLESPILFFRSLQGLSFGVKDLGGYILDSLYPFLHTRDRKSTRLNSSHIQKSRMPSSA